ncbi:unnamed protein product [Oreochromis niloticus]|nr:unnamed protein product [Mustela putorius furo]CAI5639178.1 unnamed protein product [Mustela putorius furo]CAI5639179.1 unnamed protein product [Mustela putorius furo]
MGINCCNYYNCTCACNISIITTDTNEHKQRNTHEHRKIEKNNTKYRFWLQMCMEKLVKRVVIKSGKVISGEEIEAIYKRLTNKIWAEVEDKFDEIPLNNIQKLHKMIFKALCKKWKSAEVVLIFMQLNHSAVDNIIGQVFIEEAVRLSKGPSCICRVFSFVGRLFCPCLCCIQPSNTVDMEAEISVPAFISEPKENVMAGNVTNTEQKSLTCTCKACIDRKNILIRNQKRTETDEPGTPIEKKDNREIYRFGLEICMEALVKRVVKKSGKVISGEEVEAIYKRLTNKIWAEIEDRFDEILLMESNSLCNMIFKSLCKKWKNAETVLLMMKLNLPFVDNKIVLSFIEEAAKLPKKPSRISQFFSSVGRLFCCSSRQ